MMGLAEYTRDVYLAWLASAGLSPETLQHLLEASGGDGKALCDEAFRDCRTLFGVPVPERAGKALRANGGAARLDAWARVMEEKGIRAMTMADEIYPESLRPLESAPPILFYLGDPGVAGRMPSAAMIGSRSASWKALSATEKIASALSARGICVISGLAYGVDAAAHKGCLKGGSPTVAVMGCGLDQDYPSENGPLKKRILDQGGLILSEYAPGEKPLGWHFPVRNRIISGLSDCLIVMEARIRSGSMTTVQHALDQGKDIFVYPGEPDSPAAEGNRQLLREGAIFFTSAEDIMEDMRWLDKKKEVRQNSGCGISRAQATGDEKAVYDALQRGEMSFDGLCDALDMSAGPLMSLLTMMQIKGLIDAMPGKMYRIKAE